jgi:hypothetical protein
MKHGYQRSSRLNLLVLLAMALGGCRQERAESGRFSCTCHILTDTDGSSEVVVEVCAKGRAEAGDRAPGCAQAPAPVQGCRCVPVAGACSGNAPDCTVREHR